MSAFYDLASLVVVPSGYKSGKIYAQKPLTTDGQLTFSRASTATRVNSAGLIEEVASNVPRLDYQGATCGPRLLLEPQRTNSFLESSNYANAVWEKSQISASSSAGISPDGTNNAVKIIPSTTNAGHFFTQNTAITAGTVYTQTIYAKSDGYNFVQITGSTGFNTSFYNFDLSNGTLGSTDGGVASIESAGNGWYRIRYTLPAIVSVSGRMAMALVPSATSTRLDQFAGDGTSGVLFYGAQIEAGSYPTSLINTTTAAVTRLADVCNKTGISSLIGQTEGTLFAEFDIDAAVNTEGYIARIDDTSFNDTIYISRSANSATLTMALRSGGSAIASFGLNNVSGRNKAAIAYKSGQFAFYLNGTQVATSTATYTNGITYNDFRIGGFNAATANISGLIHQALLFKTRLTNAQLAELTAL